METGKRKILKNEKLGPLHYLLSYASVFSEEVIFPGQFVSIKVDDHATVLRRPFSVFDVREKEVSIFYKVVGKGTRLLSEKKLGEEVDVLEVLGNGFDLSLSEQKVALVGGGMGVAPLYYLSRKLRNAGKDVFLYMGAQTSDEIFFEKEFESLGCHLCITTDDGSRNICGTVCCGLEPDCVSQNFQKIYACGPKPMLGAVAKIAEASGISCDVSLEEMMGCGFGVCLGCALRMKDQEKVSYKMVCKDGPVFDAKDIMWE